MFDERSEKWIKYFKTVTIIAFWFWIVFGGWAAFDNCWNCDVFDIYIADGWFIGSALLFLGSFAIGFTQLVTNMLIIQFLSNVQIIREKLEK